MKFPKSKRYVSDDNLNLIRRRRCEVCKASPPSDPDHLHHRGSGGSDEMKNLQALCRRHHTERHAIGLKSFAEKYKRPITWKNGYPERSDLK